MSASPHTDTEAPTPEIEEVQTFRRAARRIAQAPRSRKERLRALMVLGAKARESRAGVLVQQVVWEEAKTFVRNEPPLPPIHINNPVETAIRRQLAEGRVRCQACLLPLPPAEYLDRSRRQRVVELERRRLLEEAGQ